MSLLNFKVVLKVIPKVTLKAFIIISKVTLKVFRVVFKIIQFNTLLDLLMNLKHKTHIIAVIIAVIIGFELNFLVNKPMELFPFKAFLGFCIIESLLTALIFLKKKNSELKTEMTGDPMLVKCKTVYFNRIKSNRNYILNFIASTYFVIIANQLGFVQLNYIGIYSLFGLFIVVFIAFIGFQQYLYILLLLYDISKISIDYYYELIPERTSWFQLVIKISNRYKNMFFITGTLFILLFIIFSPVNTVDIIFFQGLKSNKFIYLLLTWIIIFFAIIFLYPISSIMQSKIINKILENMKEKSISQYDSLMKQSIDYNKLIYMEIIRSIHNTDTIIKKSFSWVIPTVTTSLNFIAILLTIVQNLRALGYY